MTMLSLLLLLMTASSNLPLRECIIEEWRLDLASLTNFGINSNCTEVQFMEPPGHYGGYYALNETTDGHMFYLYFENRYQDPNAPLVFWTNGGPGSSSFFGLFLENGPYIIQYDLSLCWNSYGWDVGHNIIFVDHPLNVGFSYSGSEEDTVTREAQVAEHMLQFFYAFFKAHPELRKKEFYLTGESFAGHYLPVIAYRILEANKENPKLYINFKGMLLIDPWTNPTLHYKSYPEYEYQMNLIDNETRTELQQRWKFCDYDLNYCNTSNPSFTRERCIQAYYFCEDSMLKPIFEKHPNINYYDIRKKCLTDGCYDVTNLNAFMNLKEVKERFNIPKGLKWADWSFDVYFDMLWDVGTNVTPYVIKVLEHNIEVLVSVGDQDLICNYIGNRAWIDQLEWHGNKQWEQQQDSEWIFKGKVVGEWVSTEPLTYIKIKQAGHMIPMDQPEVGLAMLSSFTRGHKIWASKQQPSDSLHDHFILSV